MQHTIPFWLAVLININIVIGAGFFLQVQSISRASGALAPVAWLMCGLLLVPLVNALAQLSLKYPRAGGIYIFSREQLGAWWGMVSGWSYYVGTAAANAAVGHALTLAIVDLPWISSVVQQHNVPMLACDAVMIIIFTLFNLRNIDFLENAQLFFTSLKVIPLLALVLALPKLFAWQNVLAGGMPFDSLVPQLPGLLFAFIGIEACCSVMDKVENSKKNAARLIMFSFAAIVAIYAVLQFAVLGVHGSRDVDPFLCLPNLFFQHPGLIAGATLAIRLGLLASYLAGFYGVFYFNNWNLHTMAKETGIVPLRFLTKLNASQVPWVAVLVQSAVVMVFLATAQIGTLYVIAGLGTVIAYALSAIAFFAWRRSASGVLAMLSCLLFFYACGNDLVQNGLMAGLPFVVILLLGLVAYGVLRTDKRA